jgi:hypothetical protein
MLIEKEHIAALIEHFFCVDLVAFFHAVQWHANSN